MADKDQSEIRALQETVAFLTNTLKAAGLMPKPVSEHAPDYVAYGSPRHAALLGLVEVKEQDLAQAQKDKYVLYASPKTGKTYRLEDEIVVMQLYPGVDPEKAATVVLRQKVNGLESGAPKVPDNAPPMFNPGNLPV